MKNSGVNGLPVVILSAKKIINFIVYLSVLALTLSCSHFSGLSATSGKNSLPLMGKERVRQVHSVAVAPFYNDSQNWEMAAYNILSSSPRISTTPSEKIEVVLRQKKKDLSTIDPENRIDSLAELGRWLRTDAVLNGIILRNGNRNELILQLISSTDSRVLWWQAVDFDSRGDSPRFSDQKQVVKKMLRPLLLYLGQSEKIPLKTDEQSGVEQSRPKKPEMAPKSGSRTRPDKKPKPDEISPM